MIHGSPLFGRFLVEVAVADSGLLQLLAQPFGAPSGSVVQHRLIDEAAALPGLSEPVEGADGSVR